MGSHLVGELEPQYGGFPGCGWSSDGPMGEEEGRQVSQRIREQVSKEEVYDDPWNGLKGIVPSSYILQR